MFCFLYVLHQFLISLYKYFVFPTLRSFLFLCSKLPSFQWWIPRIITPQRSDPHPFLIWQPGKYSCWCRRWDKITVVFTDSPPTKKRMTTKKVDLVSLPERMVWYIMMNELKRDNDFNVRKKTKKQVGDQNSLVFIYPSLITHDILRWIWEDCG